MSHLMLTTDDDRTWFTPGSSVGGRLSWQLDGPAESLELRLFWFTQGRGSEDVRIVDELTTNRPASVGEIRFQFAIPDGPCSFSGRLITLTWALEAVVSSGGVTTRTEILVSPFAVEIDIRERRQW